MIRRLSRLAVLCLMVASLATLGCGPGKSEGVPNGSLEVPQVTPSERSTRTPGARE